MSFKISNIYRDFSLMGKVSLFFIVLITIVAIFATFFSIHPVDRSSGDALQPPGDGHILGTDDLGYDIWSQISYGARISLLVGLGTAFLSAFLGGIIGIVDKIIMRLVDIMIIMPGLPLMIVMAAFFGPSLLNIILVISLFSWVMPARVIRSQVLILKEMPYIKSAESFRG